ncbi:MAG: hypothetical protein DCF16_09090 [Alphaproteobacteria bacterium]|nr:MAG: hypothetical protein DCF16_09090 [Alphaproteobacteria bacterium]
MTDIRQTRRSLWLIAQSFINVLASIFGRSEEIAARHTILRDEWRLICQWLRAGEALMRMLLLIEAAALPKPNTPMPLLREKRMRKKRMMEFRPDKPDDWRVRFSAILLERRRPRRRDAGAPRKSDPWDAARFKSAWPLAERAEALLRVFNDPLPYAQRLARRLHAVPHRARELLRHTPDLPPLVGAVAFGTVGAAAGVACATFDTS